MNNELLNNNYLYIPNFISTDRALELAHKFSVFCIENNLAGDTQAENSHSAYNFIDFLELLCEKTPEVSKFIGETVLPTYSYARVYKEDSELTIHKDRDACEISLTLHLAGDNDWPIYIKKPNGEEAKIDLKSGDAMLYFGCDAEHWRKHYTGSRYVQVFLHYVRSRGERNYAFFDNKNKEKPLLISDKNASKVEEVNKPNTSLVFKKSIEDYIIVLENVVPNDLCDLIINEYKDDEWIMAGIGDGKPNRDVRNVDTIGLSIDAVINKNKEVRQSIDDRIFQCASNSIAEYAKLFPYSMIQQDSGYELLRYNIGQFYIQHTDSFKQMPRSVSCSFALNDDYEGGDFAFWDKEKQYSLKKGSAILFPSNFMYPHEILPVTNGTRYSIVTWFI